jgi:hypothetical protein
VTLVPNLQALAAARDARTAYVAANTSTVNGYTIYPDSPPGVGWVVLGPRGTKDHKREQVKKYLCSQAKAVAMAESLPAIASE